MDYIKGVTFGFQAKRAFYQSATIKESLTKMKEKTACNTVILPVAGYQDTAYSEEIRFDTVDNPTDDDLVGFIEYAQIIGLRVILKPMSQCLDGTWRAHINFFDKEVPCEPKWSKWFEHYSNFQIHYAKIAEKTHCEMLIIGCEMVQAQRKEEYWRKLIGELRKIYHGRISYNTDKYQEDTVPWWDAVDVISSSGYYPIDQWESNLDRIMAVVEKENKPFFFAEAGCMPVKGASLVPNDWSLRGKIDLNEQTEYYKKMFEVCKQKKYSFIGGFGLWEWHGDLKIQNNESDFYSYNLYNKPVCDLIREEWDTSTILKNNNICEIRGV